MTKYYKVIKENPLWEVGAIVANTTERANGEKNGYTPIEDVWNKLEDTVNTDDWLMADTVEKSPDFFQRVYKSEGEKMVFKTAEQLKKAYKKFTE